jgi:hypothetical protein
MGRGGRHSRLKTLQFLSEYTGNRTKDTSISAEHQSIKGSLLENKIK